MFQHAMFDYLRDCEGILLMHFQDVAKKKTETGEGQPLGHPPCQFPPSNAPIADDGAIQTYRILAAVRRIKCHGLRRFLKVSRV